MKKIIYFLIIVLINIFLLQPVFGIGQITKPIVIEDVLRGQEIVDFIRLNSNKSKAEVGLLKAGGDIKDWVIFYKLEDENLANPISEIEIPADSSMTVQVKFTVPVDTPNGTYSGEISVITSPAKLDNKETTQASVRKKIDRSFSIQVTDVEIIELSSVITPASYSVVQGQDLEIGVRYNNLGNVTVKPSVQLKIAKQGLDLFNAIFPYPEEDEAIKPRVRKSLEATVWSTAGQELGQYHAEINIILNDQVIKSENFRFNINEEVINEVTVETNKFFAAISFIGGGNLMIGWLVISGIFLIAAALLIVFGRKRLAKY